MNDNSEWLAVLTDDQAPAASRQRVLEEMRTVLRGTDLEACNRALFTIMYVGMEAAELREDLVWLWHRPTNASNLRNLVPALGRVREVATLIEALGEGKHARAMRRWVPQVIRMIGRAAAAAAPALVNSFRDDDMRQEAIYALEAMGPAAVPALRAGLQDPSNHVRSRALRTLGHIGSAARIALEEVIAALEDPDAQVRTQAIYALGTLQPLSDAAISALVGALNDADRSVRWETLHALRRLGKAAAPATPALLPLLEAGDTEDPIDILCLLAAIGPEAGAAGPVLWRLLGDERGVVRVAAALALWRVTNEAAAAVATLKAALADADADVRNAAARAAPDLAPASSSLIPALMRLLGDEGESRWTAIHSLLQLGVTDPRLGEAIRESMTQGAWKDGPCSWDTGRCIEALDLISNLGPTAIQFVPLLEHLRDHYSELRSRAIFVLASVQNDQSAAIPELIAALGDQNPRRSTTAECLGEIGPAAREAVPHLIRMARFGCNGYDRKAALRALRRIEPSVADQLEVSFS